MQYTVKLCTGESWHFLPTYRLLSKPQKITACMVEYPNPKAHSWPSHPQLLSGFEIMGPACEVPIFGGLAWPGLCAVVMTVGQPGPLGTLIRRTVVLLEMGWWGLMKFFLPGMNFVIEISCAVMVNHLHFPYL
jgi:hypothetical protein